jgi:hypothetical protein
MSPENLCVQSQIDRELLSPTYLLLLYRPPLLERGDRFFEIVPGFDGNSILDSKTPQESG